MPKVAYDIMSNVKCIECHKPVKLNLVTAQLPSDKPITCFSCYRKGKTMNTASEVRTGKRIGREKGIYRV